MSNIPPILFLIFNRPDTTEQVFNSIKTRKPKQLFIAADGPRINNFGEKELCDKTREIILQNIDWDCEIKTLFREENLGCKIAVSSAITWFFEQVEYGIILEDDCLPNKSFYTYCAELLEHYKDNEKIMCISGNCFIENNNDYSYYFSQFPHIWGWASWSRAWSKYDIKLNALEELQKKWKKQNPFHSKIELAYWLMMFHRVKYSNFSTWDYQWTYSILNNEGICITPTKNLVSNIGFSAHATHTKEDVGLSLIPTYAIENIKHQNNIIIQKKYDYNTLINTINIKQKIKVIAYYFLRLLF